MKKALSLLLCLSCYFLGNTQTDPAIINWLQNTTETGSYYVSGNSTALDNGILYNCQQVEYSLDYVYVTTTGIPAYPTGPFEGGNPSLAEDQQAIFKMPLVPVQNTGTPTATSGGNIGVFINGVALFDYRDGVSWNPNTNSLCGGPGNAPCPGGPAVGQDWNRDAVWAEMGGFDCSKAHPARGNYHHHQNPSAFKLDLQVLSDICNLYDADGLYAIDSTTHSPLLGFAYDGFPIYGSYGYENADGTGDIVRIKSGYQLRNITERTHHADGTDVDDGPDVDATYFLGFFREDYEYLTHTGEDYLDEHNGRFCITPEYPAGTYAYFATVDENWNSSYPYVVGPTYYGVYENRLVSSVDESTTIYVDPGPLPVETINFKAMEAAGHIALSWITATEINNDHFVLERSTDGQTFSAIAKLPAAGNSLESQFYAYQDESYPEGLLYYRLQQVDFDKTSSYSEVISVLTGSKFAERVNVFPNPGADFISVQVKGLVKYEVAIQLFDINGKLIRTAQIVPGSTLTYIDAQAIYNGIYTVHINDGVNTVVRKIEILHN